MAQLPQACDALEYSSKSGRLAAVTSSLTGPTWDGGLVVENESGDMVNTTSINVGVNNVTWLGSQEKELLVCSCDDGTVQVWSVPSNKKHECIKYFVEHDDIATSVSGHPTNNELFLSSSWDMTIKEWDLKDNSRTTFRGHVGFVWDVEWNKKATDLFISASQDRTVKTWDRRNSKATATYTSDLPNLTVSWNPTNEYLFAFGDANGSIYIYDTRKPQDSLASFRGHTASIHKIRFSTNTGETWLATASDDTMVIVWDWKSLKSVYSYKHEDFARGISWNPKKPKHLVSAGWDKTIFFHTF